MYVLSFCPQNGDSPACILSFILTAWWRGELSEAWQWNDASQNGGVDDKAASDSAGADEGGDTPEPSDAKSECPTVGS